jgi:hypothetical protein
MAGGVPRKDQGAHVLKKARHCRWPVLFTWIVCGDVGGLRKL